LRASTITPEPRLCCSSFRVGPRGCHKNSEKTGRLKVGCPAPRSGLGGDVHHPRVTRSGTGGSEQSHWVGQRHAGDQAGGAQQGHKQQTRPPAAHGRCAVLGGGRLARRRASTSRVLPGSTVRRPSSKWVEGLDFKGAPRFDLIDGVSVTYARSGDIILRPMTFGVGSKLGVYPSCLGFGLQGAWIAVQDMAEIRRHITHMASICRALMRPKTGGYGGQEFRCDGYRCRLSASQQGYSDL
jgi:hypothetical protein